MTTPAMVMATVGILDKDSKVVERLPNYGKYDEALEAYLQVLHK